MVPITIFVRFNLFQVLKQDRNCSNVNPCNSNVKKRKEKDNKLYSTTLSIMDTLTANWNCWEVIQGKLGIKMEYWIPVSGSTCISI